MQLETFSPQDGGQERKALKFGSQKINLHDAKAPYVPSVSLLNLYTLANSHVKFNAWVARLYDLFASDRLFGIEITSIYEQQS